MQAEDHSADPGSRRRHRGGKSHHQSKRRASSAGGGSRGSSQQGSGRPPRPFASSASNPTSPTSHAVDGGACERPPSDTGSSNRGAFRKRNGWHNSSRRKRDRHQQRSSTTTSTTGAASTTPRNHTVKASPDVTIECSSDRTPNDGRENSAAPPRTKLRRDGTVKINSMVRCIDTAGGLSSKSLRDLLRMGGSSNTEADTPCLGPIPVPMQQQGGDGQRHQQSPMLAFTLDSIATPNTFASFRSPALSHASNDPNTAGSNGTGSVSGSAAARAAAITELDAMPSMAMESPYQYMHRNYVNGSFAFYDTPEARATFLEKCYLICNAATAVLEREPLMSCVQTPVYVFGDIHGNFEDLSYFLKSVLAFGDIHLSPCNVLCLGDYVDRGPYSLECVMILLALKLESPRKVTLLRGNHEDRVVCGDRRTYGSDCFLAQCQTIFGPVDGMKIFHAVTAVFRHLPLAAEIVVTNAPNRVGLLESPTTPLGAVSTGSSSATPAVSSAGWTPQTWKKAVDHRHSSHMERILCTHGGIPRFSQPPRDRDMLAFLRSPQFPRLLTLFPNNPLVRDDPEAKLDGIDEETLQKAWYVMFDLMWSDPTPDDSAHTINEWGFGFNTRGNNVVSFSAKAVDTFLDAFHYTMLFRAHQEKAHGIRLSKSQKVLTVFSSSNYLGHGNGAGCVIVNQQGQVQLIVKTSQ